MEISTHIATGSRIPGIRLESMPQLVHATSQVDDWTGTSDATARRRAQTRLNTRAYPNSLMGQRKALARREEQPRSSTEPVKKTVITTKDMIVWWDHENQSFSVVPQTRDDQQYDSREALLLGRPAARQVKVGFPLCPDHLITLLQYNTLRALITNRSLISSILDSPLRCNEETVHIVPYPANPESIPSTLLPTLLQQTIPHGDWIDLFPCPVGRDFMIRAAGTFDEDELWSDIIGGLYEGFPDDEIERRGVVAWSPSWTVQGWEMSEGYLKKWGWLYKDVPGMLEATNHWRAIRGERALSWEEISSVQRD